MMGTTKRERAKYVAENVLTKHSGKTLPLQEWVSTINDSLGNNRNLRNTRETAKMFCYIMKTLHKNIIREKVGVADHGTMTYYTFLDNTHDNQNHLQGMQQ